VAGVEPSIDWFNIMMYDCAGPRTDDGQLHSPIFRNPKKPPAVGQAWMKLPTFFRNDFHVPAAKLNVGTPFYGYYYKNVSELYGPCKPCDNQTVLSEAYGTYIKQRVNQQGWQCTFPGVWRSCLICCGRMRRRDSLPI
jgi:GH18 family chitinase